MKRKLTCDIMVLRDGKYRRCGKPAVEWCGYELICVDHGGTPASEAGR